MIPLFSVLLVVVAVMMLARWFVNATPQAVVRTAKWTGAAVLLGGGAIMLATGRGGWLLAVAAGLVPWALRVVRMRTVTQALRDAFQRMTGDFTTPGSSSQIETRFLRMALDHDSGALSGEVLDGPFRGRRLSQLSFDEAIELRRQCAADAQSVQVLEAWLDRTWSDWRDRMPEQNRKTGGGGDRDTSSHGSGAMTRDEALAVLGLQSGASRVEVKAAHRRLMSVLHPDHGGSNYLAAKINQAKDILLRD